MTLKPATPMKANTLGILLSLLFVTGSGKAEVRYIGHATVLIQGGTKNILTDPFWGDKILGRLRRRIPPAIRLNELPRIDVVLISHTHVDHYDETALYAMTPRPVVIVPWGRGDNLKKDFRVVQLRPWQSYEIPGVKITAVPARHMVGHCLGYLVKVDETKIYFTGDTKLHPGLERLKEEKIDLMLLPYGGYPYLGSIWTTTQAVEAIRRVSPKAVIPVHWGTFNRWWTRSEPEGPEAFAQQVKTAVADTNLYVLQVGETWPGRLRSRWRK